MAEQPLTTDRDFIIRSVRRFEWKNLANGDHCAPITIPDFSDKTAHVFGTFGSGGSITVYGSNNEADLLVEPTNGASTWVALKDNLDNNITKTAIGGDIIIENYLFMSAEVTAGDGDTDLTLIISAKRVR